MVNINDDYGKPNYTVPLPLYPSFGYFTLGRHPCSDNARGINGTYRHTGIDNYTVPDATKRRV